MCRMHAVALWAVLVLLATGCGKSDGKGQASTTPQEQTNAQADDKAASTPAKLDGPALAVYEFLEAIRTGNDEKTINMLSTLAREKTAAKSLSVAPTATDTAKFTVGKVDYVGEDGARVAFTWTDLDINGQWKTDEAFWVARRDHDGWKIAGMAIQIPEIEKTLVLNFEDPDDMVRQKKWADEEMRRRAKAEQAQETQEAENLEKGVRR
jgi:hypothetical protein